VTTEEWSTMTDAQKGVMGANVADNRPNMSKQFETLAKQGVTAVLHHEGRLDSKKSSNVLAAMEEMKTTASLAVDIEGVREDCHDEEDDLPELTDGSDSESEDGFLDQEDHEIAEHHMRKLGESEPKTKATFCDDEFGTRGSLAEFLPTCMRAFSAFPDRVDH
ncbi:hypothetical protein CYMTET_31016, partial [Cymbomonas tetramitiformis]